MYYLEVQGSFFRVIKETMFLAIDIAQLSLPIFNGKIFDLIPRLVSHFCINHHVLSLSYRSNTEQFSLQ